MRRLRASFFPLLSVLLLLTLGVVGYLYVRERSSGTNNPADPVIAKLSTILTLPQNERAQVTTIENVEAAKQRDAAFFATAAVGDTLIAYEKLLILYDMKANRIKNIMTFGTKPPPGPTKALKVALRYNGNEEPRAKDLQQQMEAASPNYTIVEVAKSPATYEADVIYLVNPARRDDAITLGQGLGGSPVISELADAEAPTEADIIVAFRDIP